jgi:SAM-dependent methyltransferase
VLAYYSVAADREFWSEHWGGQTPEQLLAVARTSPLTDLIVGALPPTGVVLEAGCGLGQYVRLLRERGWNAIGVEWSTDALATARRAWAMPLAAMDLTALAMRPGSVTSYISLGVVEHNFAGPDAILAEARRVLAPGGTLVISVPYVNGLRRLAAPWMRRQSRAVEAAGGKFYQYFFTRADLLAALGRHGFSPLSAHPYDPARILRKLWPRRSRAAVTDAGSVTRAATLVSEHSPRVTAPHTPPRRRGLLRRVARGVLYTEPALRLLGHMLLVVARRG